MNIQASRLTAAIATPASAAPRQSAAAASGATELARSTDKVTISQAARDLLAAAQPSPAASETPSHTVLAVGLAAPHSEASTPGQVNPFSSPSGDYQAALRKAMDKLQFAHSNKQVSDTQFKHDMDFYTRVSIAV